MSELKANVEMLEKHFTETIGREVRLPMVPLVKSGVWDH